MEISHAIKKIRTELNITQEELAKQLNVTKGAISNWEVGRNYPDIQPLVKLSDELNISLDQLLREDEKMVSSMDKKIKKRNFVDKYYVIFLTIVSMTLVGYFTFENWASTIIFGLISGGIFGVIIDSIGKEKIK